MSRDEAPALRRAVREAYAAVANGGGGCCQGSDCCAPGGTESSRLGYSPDQLGAAPQGADLGLGCGNPQAIAALCPGETVLDLGSGAGFDCFLAAAQVGPQGRVVGVDMTPEMVARAQENAERGGYANVEFRRGEIEALPLADGTVDVIISNCVINLSPEKGRVFAEAFRVLRPGGRLAISDIVAGAELPPQVREDLALYTGCMAGASSVAALEAMLSEAGFTDIVIAPKMASREFIREWAPGRRVEEYVVSATIEARKPMIATSGERGMKSIKVLGSGCRNCQTTYDLIREVAAAKGTEVTLEKVEDIGQIMGFGVMSTPGVVIDGEVVHAGGIPSRAEVEGWLG